MPSTGTPLAFATAAILATSALPASFRAAVAAEANFSRNGATGRAAKPATMLGADGRPSSALIRAQARWLLADPDVTSYGPRRQLIRSAIRFALQDAHREAERAAMSPERLAAENRIARLVAEHDALFYSPGRFHAMAEERAELKRRIAAEEAALEIGFAQLARAA